MRHFVNLRPAQNNIHRLGKLFIVVFLVSLFSACSTTEVKQDYSSSTQFIKYQHYSWLADANALKVESDYPFVAKRIKSAILKTLHGQDAMIVRDRPQAYISFDYLVTRTEKLEPSTTVGIGWGGPHWGFKGMIPVEYETTIDEKTEWVVRIFNRQKQLIWQGNTTSPFTQFNNPKEAEAFTDSIIQQIMAQYPPKN